MRKLFITFSTVCALVVLAIAGATVAQAQDAISGTSHNLSTTGLGAVTSNEAGICVFCHTPHGGASTAPLWNRTLDSVGYTMYSSGSIDNVTAATPEGISLACLSCHDGVTALDSLINFPGSGLGTEASIAIVGGDIDESLLDGGITNVSKDLSNDHPISIEYGVADTAMVLAATVEATLPLYDGGTNPNQVECASCHNPHEGTLPTFLRIANTASSLCLTCHVK